MIFGGEFVTGIDLVDVCLWLFTIFFFGLVLWLQRESHREGYPTETDETGKVEPGGLLFMPPAKTFLLPHGRGQVSVPPGEGDKRELAIKRVAPWAGSPYEPTGNPMKDGVGPASYAEREDVPDLTDDGRPRIVPTRLGDGFDVAPEDVDPRGMPVFGADAKRGGTVTDIWVDRSEHIIRYLEVNTGTADDPHSVLLPMGFAKVNRRRGRIEVDAVHGHHFKDVPTTKDPSSVTRLEEDKICGYFGGGKLYAEPSRAEPFI